MSVSIQLAPRARRSSYLISLIEMLASTVSEPDKTAPQVLKALQNAGADVHLESKPAADAHSAANTNPQRSQELLEPRCSQGDISQEAISNHSSAASSRSSSKKGARPDRLKKRVSFANNTKSEPESAPHPRSLPSREREQLLLSICQQVEEEVDKDPVSKKFKGWHQSGMFGEETLLEMLKARKLGIADRFLKLPAFRETRRLFKAEHLNRSQAAQHIILMIEEMSYRLPLNNQDQTQDANTIGEVTDHDLESSTDDYTLDDSADPEPEVVSDILTKSTGDTSGVHDEFITKFDEQFKSAVLAMGELVLTGEMTTIEHLKYLRQLLDNRPRLIEAARIQSAQAATVGRKEHDVVSKESTNAQGKQDSTKSSTHDEPDLSSENDLSAKIAPSHIFPDNESAEDSALRRQMIQYSMGEVGAVVAELDIDDETTEPSDDEDDGEIDFGDTSPEEDADEEEDKFGRSAARVLSNDYLADMQALEKKLKAQAMVNVGPDANLPASSNVTSNDLEELLDNVANADDVNKKPSSTKSKGVRFAAELDIQEAPLVSSVAGNKRASHVQSTPKPADNGILERDASAQSLVDTAAESRIKMSQRNSAQTGNLEDNKHIDDPIKANGASDEAEPNRRPMNAPHASTIVERPWSASSSVTAAQGVDEFDSALLNQQVSTEYHRVRNRMIQREGGFLARDDEKAVVPLTEEEGGPKKMSRFKLARLGQR